MAVPVVVLLACRAFIPFQVHICLSPAFFFFFPTCLSASSKCIVCQPAHVCPLQTHAHADACSHFHMENSEAIDWLVSFLADSECMQGKILTLDFYKHKIFIDIYIPRFIVMARHNPLAIQGRHICTCLIQVPWRIFLIGRGDCLLFTSPVCYPVHAVQCGLCSQPC